MSTAIQDLYPEQFAHCHGCGPSNPAGMQLKSYVAGEETVARFTPAAVFTGGVPDHVYGGLIASLLDCHGAASAAAFAHRERGGVVAMGESLPRFVTGTLNVRYEAPTPMGVELVVRGRLKDHNGRKVSVSLELTAAGAVCATGEMIAFEIKPDQ